MQRLVLFDIDGTILTSDGAAARAFRRALEETFGTSGPRTGYSFAGRTDPQIARDLLRMAGLGIEEVERGLPEVWKRYLSHLRRELETIVPTVFPGVRELIERLAGVADAAVTGLLTGNIAEGARLKLERAGLDPDAFTVGAFGSDHHDRRELPQVAIDRAESRYRHRFEGKSVVVIGDTPADVACGAHLGVRTIAVATGTFDEADLAECGPDHLFADLSDTDSVWRAIFS